MVMASLRKTLLQKIRDPRAAIAGKTAPSQQQHTHPLLALLATAALSLAQALLLLPCYLHMRLVGPAEGSQKGAAKMSSWKKLLVQFGVCFTIGLCLGWFTPHKWMQHSLAVDGRPFFGDAKTTDVDLSGRFVATNALMDAKTATKGRDMISFDAAKNNFSGVGVNFEMPLEYRKLLIIVTPTYVRPFGAYYLTRLAHTLKLVPPPLLWLVVEMHYQSLETAQLLRETGIMYRHLVCDKNLTNVKDRAASQRNTALAHIEHHELDGIVYFADDGNMYTLELFEQMRNITRFGTWLVGILAPGKSRVVFEGPVCEGEKVIGWHTSDRSKRLRRFHVDMSGFAFNSTMLWDPRRWKRPTLEPIRQLDSIKESSQQTSFIEQLVPDESYMEGRPPGCLKIMVWHLQLEAPKGFPYPARWTLTTPLEANIPLRKANLVQL
ncbi:probable beta-1,4-xylosyltransferase IRX9H [Physcomitrium patens]|uniref:Glycosyltransferases n=1 Tax=Physcomitrium patens TaxID=3218 RepID=A0A1B1IJJ7_PHYPA|nr:probable beta-1,4-xylosyltransferase IRX9H [Physcomitrium patens]ANR94916.1 GT43B [Physcomitrium patens]PNR56967.1 hypothetical protein PHYPA_003960 [Physcomitrium patens]|eukprot:XP_024370762.1 probable beta-1,4-xylosyltransferase IRX9H [Physcomitrella patens]